MKKLIVILILFTSAYSFAQPVVSRSLPVNTVQDGRLMPFYNLFAPRYLDTTAANVQKGIDSCGAIIYTYVGNTMWYRGCNPKKWIQIGSGGSGGSLTLDQVLTNGNTSLQSLTAGGVTLNGNSASSSGNALSIITNTGASLQFSDAAGNGYGGIFNTDSLTGVQVWSLPPEDGTIATRQWVRAQYGYLPSTGGGGGTGTNILIGNTVKTNFDSVFWYLNDTTYLTKAFKWDSVGSNKISITRVPYGDSAVAFIYDVVPANISLSTLGGSLNLSQIAQGGATTNQVLTWNGTAWAPAAGGAGSSVATSSATTLTLGTTTETYVFTGSSNTVWTLPAISGNTAKKYLIKNRGSANITLTAAGSDNLYTTSSVGTLVILPGDAYVVQNDGTYWVIM